MSVPETLREEAAEWVVRLSAEDAGEADFAAFQGWLAAHADARATYDAALDLWLPVAGAAPHARGTRVAGGRSRSWALAAALAGLVVLAGSLGLVWSGRASSQVLRTATGERRDFDLADGSRVTLGADSLVTVHIGLDRRVVMERGDAVFHVSSQIARPFEVVAGDDALRVVGTEFGVHRRDGRLRIVVRRGLVAIGPAQGEVGPRVRLPAGSELNHLEGTETFQVAAVDPEAAFAW